MVIKEKELLSSLGVGLVCHASNVFLVLKPTLSMIKRFSKSIGRSCDQAWFVILEPLTFLKCSFFSGVDLSNPLNSIWRIRSRVRRAINLYTCTKCLVAKFLIHRSFKRSRKYGLIASTDKPVQYYTVQLAK